MFVSVAWIECGKRPCMQSLYKSQQSRAATAPPLVSQWVVTGYPRLIISVLEEVEVEMEGKIDLAADLYMPGTRVG